MRDRSVAYVEFLEVDDVKRAMALTGTKLLGIPLNVQYTEAERNRQAQAGIAPAAVARERAPQASNVPDHIKMWVPATIPDTISTTTANVWSRSCVTQKPRLGRARRLGRPLEQALRRLAALLPARA